MLLMVYAAYASWCLWASAVCGLSLLCINAYLSVKVSDVYSFESYMLIFYSVWIFVTFLITLHPSLVSSNKPIKTSIVSIIEIPY